MANVKILTWNIRNFGLSNLEKANYLGIPWMNYVATSILLSEADVVCIQELMFSVAQFTPQVLLDMLNYLSGKYAQPFRWASSAEASAEEMGASSYEGYLFLWKSNAFTMQPLSDPSTNSGLYGNAVGQYALPNNSNSGTGRGAGYMLMTPAGSANTYLLLSYHAPSVAPGAPAALAQMPAIWQNSQSTAGWGQFDPPLAIKPAGILICGDFNVDYGNSYTALQPTLYAAAQNVTSSLTQLTEATDAAGNKILEPTAAQQQATTTQPFLVNAFDNILYGGAVTATAPAALFDGIYLASVQAVQNAAPGMQQQAAQVAALLSQLALELKNPAIWQTQQVTALISNLSVYESFVLYYYAVSDHMPVLGSFNLP